MSWPIRKKLLLFLLIIFLPAIAAILATGLSQRRNDIAKAGKDTMMLVQSLAAQQEQVALTTKTMLTTLARLPEVQRLDRKACDALFQELNRQYPFYTVILAVTPDGRVFAASKPFQPSTDLSDRKHVRDAIGTLDFSAGEYVVGRVSNARSLNFAYPVLSAEKKLIAIVIAGFNLSEYERFVSRANLPTGYSVAISDWKGLRLFRLPKNDASSVGKPVPRDVMEMVTGGADQGFFERRATDGVNRLYAFGRVRLRENLPPYLYVFVGLPKAGILRNANLQMVRNLSVLGLAALFAMGLAWVFGNFALIKPINRLVAAAQRFGEGELNTRTGLPHTADELGRLAESFDHMASLVEKRKIERDRVAKRQELANRILETLSSSENTASVVRRIPLLLREHTGIEAIGIRLRSGEDFPYFEADGFPRDFVTATSSLCVYNGQNEIVRDSSGKAQLECLCGAVIAGRASPPPHFFTMAGSFWTNSMTDLLASASPEDLKGPARDRCVREGYESVALVPLRSGEETVGLIQLNDRQRGRFNPGFIEFLEGIAASIGIALSRKEAEERVAASERKYRDIFERAFEGIFRASVDGKFIDVNPALARMHGFSSRKEMLDEVGEEVGRLYVNPEDFARFRRTLKKQGSVERHETSMHGGDGRTIWVSMSARAVTNEAGATLYYEGMVEEITGRKMAELSLRKALADLESEHEELGRVYRDLRESQKKIIQQEKMASIGQLAAGVAHEINNPMGFIMSNLNSLGKYVVRISEFIGIQSEALEAALPGNNGSEALLARAADTRRSLKIDYLLEDSQSLIRESLDGAERVKRIVQDLKNFARADEGEHKPAGINETLESTLNIVWNELKYKATVTKEYGEVPMIRCNPGLLSQVFMNLLVNAAQAIPDHGEIKIRTWTEDTRISIAISDTGCGIPEDQIGRLFEPFYTTKEVGKGTGLGLSIAYDIVKKHHGEIEVRSAVGKGTTFTVSLPMEA